MMLWKRRSPIYKPHKSMRRQGNKVIRLCMANPKRWIAHLLSHPLLVIHHLIFSLDRYLVVYTSSGGMVYGRVVAVVDRGQEGEDGGAQENQQSSTTQVLPTYQHSPWASTKLASSIIQTLIDSMVGLLPDMHKIKRGLPPSNSTSIKKLYFPTLPSN